MSLLRKLIPRVLVDSSFISAGSFLEGEVGVVFLSGVSLRSGRFSLLGNLSTQVCDEDSSGEETEVSPLPSSKRKVNQ